MKQFVLSKDYGAVLRYIRSRVRTYADYYNDGPGDHTDMIRRVTLGFSFEGNAWAALVFDTRGDQPVDDAWQDHVQENCILLDHWASIAAHLQEFPAGEEDDAEPSLTLITHDGEPEEFYEYDPDDLAVVFGDTLWATLVEARGAGILTRLPLAQGCLMDVREVDGRFLWPRLEDQQRRGTVV
ncbi:MAG: hypothetical protein AAFP90_12785 [Planctomycetota bacterium]